MRRAILPTLITLAAVTAPALAAKPPKNPPGATPTVTIVATPSTVTFGSHLSIAGLLSGPGASGVAVTLEQNAYPFTGPFRPVGPDTTTDATGHYAFLVTPGAATRYEVVAKTKHPVTSSAVGVRVRLRVGLGVTTTRPRRGQLVRFAGLVTPAHNGRAASLQKLTRTGFRTIRRTTLRAATVVNGVARSRYFFRIRVYADGTYRVVAASGDADHLPGLSHRRTLRVHG